MLASLPTLAAPEQKPGSKLSKKECKTLDRRIKRLASKRRQGHSARQARAWKRQARELQHKRYRQCR